MNFESATNESSEVKEKSHHEEVREILSEQYMGDSAINRVEAILRDSDEDLSTALEVGVATQISKGNIKGAGNIIHQFKEKLGNISENPEYIKAVQKRLTALVGKGYLGQCKDFLVEHSVSDESIEQAYKEGFVKYMSDVDSSVMSIVTKKDEISRDFDFWNSPEIKKAAREKIGQLVGKGFLSQLDDLQKAFSIDDAGYNLGITEGLVELLETDKIQLLSGVIDNLRPEKEIIDSIAFKSAFNRAVERHLNSPDRFTMKKLRRELSFSE